MTDIETPCIEWDGRRDRRGYGRRNELAVIRQYGTSLVHRHVWIDAHGIITPATVVMHLCDNPDNPACYRLDHLRAGTQRENLNDMRRKGRARNGNENKTHCPHGHPFDAENTYVTRQGWRWCRECGRKRARERQRRARQASEARG